MTTLGYTDDDRRRDNEIARSLGKVEGLVESALERLTVAERKLADVEKKTWTHSGIVGVVSLFAGYIGTHINKFFG